MKIKPPLEGYKRQWIRCKRCGRVQYYDFVPYSLSSPVTVSACGHGAAEPMHGRYGWAKCITADEAIAELVR